MEWKYFSYEIIATQAPTQTWRWVMVTIHPDPNFSLEGTHPGHAYSEASGIPCLSHKKPSEEIYDFCSSKKDRVKLNTDLVLPFLLINCRANQKVNLVVSSTLFNSVAIHCISALSQTLCLLNIWISDERQKVISAFQRLAVLLKQWKENRRE